MGKLATIRNSRLARRIFSSAIALGLFAVVQPAIVKSIQAAGTYAVGSEVVDGHQQVYLLADDVKSMITVGRENHFNPVIAQNNYVAYTTSSESGSVQITLYDISTQTFATLAGAGTNLHPQVDNGKVVWESWMGDRWQIFLYDGSSVAQISSSDSAVRPDIEGDFVVYALKNDVGQWEAYQYSISAKQTTLLGTGDSFAWPRLSGGEVRYNSPGR